MLVVNSDAQLCHGETALKLQFLSLVNFYSDSDINYINLRKKKIKFLFAPIHY